jgi:formate dehydrogenase subunit gamma
MADPGSTLSAERVQRHAGVDRAFHWITALVVLTLLATGLLPVAGVKFPWVTIHWIAGVVLALAVAFHLIRATFWQRLRCVWIGLKDLRDALRHRRAAKYSLAQKLMHHAMTGVIVTLVITGLCMLAKVDTPWWKRNPYFFAADTWGVIYVLHGAAALATVTLVMIHIYFALLPEKRLYLRAMWRGWDSPSQFAVYHDPARWPGPAGERR